MSSKDARTLRALAMVLLGSAAACGAAEPPQRAPAPSAAATAEPRAVPSIECPDGSEAVLSDCPPIPCEHGTHDETPLGPVHAECPCGGHRVWHCQPITRATSEAPPPPSSDPLACATPGAACDGGQTCSCCPLAGGRQRCRCTTPCRADADCRSPEQPSCDHAAGQQGLCSTPALQCCWGCR